MNIYNRIVKSIPNNIKDNLKKIKFIDRLNLSLRRLNKPEFIITKENHKIFLDKNDSMHLSIYKEWGELESSVMKKYVKKGMTVLDLGANIGYFTLILAKLVGNSGVVYSFEPDINNFDLLLKNVKENNYKNVIPLNRAVSNKNGIVNFYLSKENFGWHNLYDKSLKQTKVYSVILDKLLETKKIDFIKMDIEGAEGEALKGMIKLIDRNKLKMIAELHPELLNKSSVKKEEYLRLLKERGFKFYNINEETNKVEKTNIDKLNKEYPSGRFTDMLLIK